MHDFGQEAHGGFSGLKKVPPFEVPLPAGSRDGAKMCGAVFGQARYGPLWNVAGVLRFVTTCHNVNTIAIEGRRQPPRLRMHRVAPTRVIDFGGGSYLYGIRSETASGKIRRGLRRVLFSSSLRAGTSPVARDGRVQFTSWSHSASCCTRSS